MVTGWSFCRPARSRAVAQPGYLLAALLMILRDTGVFDHGFGVLYLVFAAATLLGHVLEWRYRRRTGSKYRLA